MSIRISVIVPVFNLEKYIGRCLDSLVAQTYTDIEILVIDDGSQDNSFQIIREYERKYGNIKCIKQKNSGVVAARLSGIAQATGNYIGFVDGDDYVEPDMYELLISNMQKYKADISHCGYQMIFPDGRRKYFYNTGEEIWQNNIQGQIDLLCGEKIEPGLVNKLYKRELFDQLEIDRSIKINEDLLMNYYLFQKANSSIFYDVCKYHYIIRNSSASRQDININKIKDPIKVKKLIMDTCREPQIKSIAEKMYLTTLLNIYNQIIVDDYQHKYEKQKQEIYVCLLRNNDKKDLLTKRQKILLWLLFHANKVYPYIYRLYNNYFQKKKYE